MNKKAFENPSGQLFTLSDETVEEGLSASRESDRLRIILPIHRQQEAKVQRLINFLQPGTYIRPHKHPLPHATESVVLLQGSIRFFTFDGDGKKVSDQVLHSEGIPDLIDIEPDTWHSFLVLAEDTIIFECKKGPYNAQTDKEFASWAPEEGSDDVHTYMKELAK
jgi:cupin fold WbuC family metalloprotein